MSSYFGHVYIIKHLLANNCDSYNAFDSGRALSLAARIGRYKVVDVLLNLNPRLEAVPIDGNSALCWASMNGHMEISKDC